MIPKKSSYIKAFCIFLLMIAAESAVMVLIKSYLNDNDMATDAALLIVRIVLVALYILSWIWLRRRLNAIES
ncbi:MAG: hypothetical protein K2K45_12345 [Muribaculaceae bacterium]|nr:hypothetical protein [Muribaculaceae bacterium]